MIGHDKIIVLRKQGLSPTDIFVDEDKVCIDWFNPGERYSEVWEPDYPHVCIPPEDDLNLLDLRFSYGLVVHVSGSSEKRTKALFEAFKPYASRVIGCYAEEVAGKEYFETKWIQVWQR